MRVSEVGVAVDVDGDDNDGRDGTRLGLNAGIMPKSWSQAAKRMQGICKNAAAVCSRPQQEWRGKGRAAKNDKSWVILRARCTKCTSVEH